MLIFYIADPTIVAQYIFVYRLRVARERPNFCLLCHQLTVFLVVLLAYTRANSAKV